ncbi:MAG TPA: FtsX-like permease family protein, partial [Herpetosiphonaceae bacterium]
AASAALPAAGAEGRPAQPLISYNERLLPWMGGSGRSNYARFFLALIATLVALIVGGSALVIYNAFAISIGERKRQFGMFASAGATAAQIRRIVLTEAGVIAAIGIPLGILGAIGGVAVLLRLTQGIVARVIADAEQGMPLVVSPLVIALTILFAAATILLSAWIPARRAARVSSIDAIRLIGELAAGQQLPASSRLRTSPLIRRLFGFEGELALKSLKRDRKKYFTTVLSLMISIILFVAFNALMLYATTTQRMASQAMGFDLLIDLDYRQTRANDFAAQVGALPEVQRVAFRRCTYQRYVPPRAGLTDQARQALRELNLPLVGEGGQYQFVLQVCAVGPAEFAHYLARLGLDPAPYADPAAPRGILVNHYNQRRDGKLYDFDLFTLKPGDPIAIAPEGGATAGLTWTVGAVTGETPLSLMGVGPALVADLVVSDAVFDGLRDRLLQLGPINPGAMYVKSDAPDAAAAAIKRLYQSTVGGNFSYQSMAEFNQSGGLQTLLMKLFFYGFLALITLIGVTNIINTLDTNIKLRRREIAMLRSVGLTPGGFRRMLRYESLFYGLTALLYGLPLGIALSAFIHSRFDGVSTFAFTLPWGAIAACVLGVLAIVFVTMAVSGAMIRNDNIADTIKEENA